MGQGHIIVLKLFLNGFKYIFLLPRAFKTLFLNVVGQVRVLSLKLKVKRILALELVGLGLNTGSVT